MNAKTLKDMGVHEDIVGGAKSYQELYMGGHVDLDNPKRKYTVAIYRQHKNGYFYLKRIGRIVDVNKREGLFNSEVITIRLCKKMSSTKRKIHIVLYPYRYKKSLKKMLPDQTNPYNMVKGKNGKKKPQSVVYVSEPLFEITLDKVK